MRRSSKPPVAREARGSFHLADLVGPTVAVAMVQIVGVILVFLLFLLLPDPAAPHYAHSLVINLTVQSQSRPGQPWYKFQGSVDKEPFLQYDSDSNKVRPLGPLGEKVKATTLWTELPQTLRDMGPELRMTVTDIRLEGNKTRGPPTLQAELSCQCEVGRCTGGPLKFNISEQTTLVFEPMSKNWIVVGPGAREVKEDWEKNGQVEHFRKISTGDCNRWLGDFLDHWEKVLEPPVPPLPSSASPPTTQKNTSSIIAGVFGSILFGVILSLGVWMWKSGRMKAAQCCPSTTSQGPSVETMGCFGGEELNMVSGGSPAELVDVSGADPCCA
ncbi:retinoic acid early transcript 1E isoform X2 [Phyllostomus hastatus]|uniref:retinoic acid early transcript 1E isoform X2 n=1 Tax=Phyllostomus hastatus TaxID=9423 RepID=UPI001E684993|nr:retinoic acid early transcript 1E isoform X2 [Phyllostomus hastatus]